MSIITQEIAWPSWKFGVLKLSMVAFGILIGSAFHEFWLNWHVALWIVFAVTALATTIWGFRSILTLEPDRRHKHAA